jgi:hypothetical protein
LEELTSCSTEKWITTKKATKNGNKKCNPKNLPNVALFMAYPPHTRYTTSSPIYGITVNKLVITVAAQKLIWPQGKTYPKKAVAISIKYIVTPLIQTLVLGN